jgi:hypothetical protein
MKHSWLAVLLTLFTFSVFSQDNKTYPFKLNKKAAPIAKAGFKGAISLPNSRFAVISKGEFEITVITTLYDKDMTRETEVALPDDCAKGYDFKAYANKDEFIYFLMTKSSMFVVVRLNTVTQEFSQMKSGFIKDYFLSVMVVNGDDIILLGVQGLEQTGLKPGGGSATGFSKKNRPVIYTVNFASSKINYKYISGLDAEKKMKFDEIYYSSGSTKAYYRYAESDESDKFYYRSCDYATTEPAFNIPFTLAKDRDADVWGKDVQALPTGELFSFMECWPKNTYWTGFQPNKAWFKLSISDGQGKSVEYKVMASSIEGIQETVERVTDMVVYRTNADPGELDTIPVMPPKNIKVSFSCIKPYGEGYLVVLDSKAGRGKYESKGTPLEEFKEEGYQLMGYHVLYLSKTGSVKWTKYFPMWNRSVAYNFGGGMMPIIKDNDCYLIYPSRQKLQVNKLTIDGELTEGYARLNTAFNIKPTTVLSPFFYYHNRPEDILVVINCPANEKTFRQESPTGSFIFKIDIEQ